MMSNWYALTPIDTLFFRGNEPMEAGQLIGKPLFPPPPSVIIGALRTEYLQQRRISFDDYNRGNVDREILNTIGASGQPAPFSLFAVLLRKGSTLYAPCPATLFRDIKKDKNSPPGSTGFKLKAAQSLRLDTKPLNLQSFMTTLPFVVVEEEASSLVGHWIKIDALARPLEAIQESDICIQDNFISLEPRIGIGLDSNGKVVTGKMYSANHIRLHEDVSILIGLEGSLDIEAKGILHLGGEGRRCGYERIEGFDFKRTGGISYVNLAPIEATHNLLDLCVCSSKLMTTAGWDLAKGFHKPTASWFNSGSVFTDNVTGHCMALQF